jgi:hypothetical protein
LHGECIRAVKLAIPSHGPNCCAGSIPAASTSKAEKLGELRPTPRPHPQADHANRPSEPEEATVILATLSKPKHAASEYSQR